jgi:hypothetical protein
MPKKSDRNGHESAMQSLLPKVSLEEDPEGESEQSNSSTELQKSSSTEESNSSTTQNRAQASSQAPTQKSTPATEADAPASEEGTSSEKTSAADHSLKVLPPERPNLKQKLGPYVSQEVDEALEEVYLLLRRRLSGKASKSLIVEAALRYALSDYLQRGEDSEVAKWLKVVLEE